MAGRRVASVGGGRGISRPGYGALLELSWALVVCTILLKKNQLTSDICQRMLKSRDNNPEVDCLKGQKILLEDVNEFKAQ